MHNLELAGALVLVLAGVIMVVAQLVAKPEAVRPGQPVAAGQIIGWSAHDLGLLHRLGARLIVSRCMVSDAEFEAAERLMARASWWDGVAGPNLGARLEVLRPLLQLEQLVERMESLSARLRGWRPGRARGQG